MSNAHVHYLSVLPGCRSNDYLEHIFLTTEVESARGQAILIMETPFEWEGCPIYFTGQSKPQTQAFHQWDGKIQSPMEGVKEREYFLNNNATEYAGLLRGKMEVRALAPV